MVGIVRQSKKARELALFDIIYIRLYPLLTSPPFACQIMQDQEICKAFLVDGVADMGSGVRYVSEQG